SAALTHLSLSLSLSCPSSTPRLAADLPRAQRRSGHLSGVGLSLCICRSRRVCSSVVATALIVVSAFEEAPARAPTRVGSDVERRGLFPFPAAALCNFNGDMPGSHGWGVCGAC